MTKITGRQLRQIIREELFREAAPGETSSPMVKKTNTNMKSGQDNKIGAEVVISSSSFVGNSEIGFLEDDKTSIQGDSNIINSNIVGNTIVSNSDINSSMVANASKIEHGSKLEGVSVQNSNIWDATLIAPVGPNGYKDARKYEIYGSMIKDSLIKESKVGSSKITGYSNVYNAEIASSELVSSDVSGGKLLQVKMVAATITFTDSYDGIATVEQADIAHVDITDTRIGGSASIKCTRGSESFIKLANIYGPVKISGSVKIAGLVSEKDGHKQEAEISGNAQVSGNAQISGRVTGNAQVSGYAEVHGLAHVTGDCKVSGSAKMISGTFTTGEYTSGEHEGGDGLVDRVMKAFNF